MTDIQAIKTAAEAAQAETQGTAYVSCGNKVLDMMKRLQPATVLELCRLAEIGLASNGESGVQRGHSLPRQLQWEDGIEPAKMPKDGAV